MGTCYPTYQKTVGSQPGYNYSKQFSFTISVFFLLAPFFWFWLALPTSAATLSAKPVPPRHTPVPPLKRGPLPAPTPIRPLPNPAPKPPPSGWSSLPIPGTYVTGLAPDPFLANGIFLTTLKGIFHSNNGGQNWATVTALGEKPAFAVTTDTLRKIVYVARNSIPSLYNSSDDGKTWQPLSNGLNGSLPNCPACVSDFIATSLVISPSNHFHLWTGGVLVGRDGFTDAVFISHNAGQSWQQVTNSFGQGLNALAVATDFDKIAYVTEPTGGGIQKTTNGGLTWRQIPLPGNGGDGQAVFVDPTQPTTVLVSADGNHESLVYRSLDRGETWSIVLHTERSSPAGQGAGPFLINKNAIFVIMPGHIELSTDHGATWQAFEFPIAEQATAFTVAGGRYYIGLDGAGVISTSDGKNWQTVNTGLTSGAAVLASARTNNGLLYAANLSGFGSRYRLRAGHIFVRSTNGGTTWLGLISLVGLVTLEIDPLQTGVLLAGTNHGVYRSSDGGQNWQFSGLAHHLVTVLRFAPGGDKLVYALADDSSATARTVYVSNDGAGSWQISRTGLPAHFDARQLAINPAGSSLYLAGFNGAGIYRSTNQGASWAMAGNVPPLSTGLDYDQVSISGNQIYALLSSNPGILALGNTNNQNWQEQPTPFSSPTYLATDPANPRVIYAINSSLYRSSDRGSSWEDLHFPGSGLLTLLLVVPGPFGTIVYTGNSIGVWRFR